MRIESQHSIYKKSARLLYKSCAVFGALFGILTIVVFGVLSFQSSPSIGESSSDKETYRQLSLFGDAFQLIRNEYVEDIDDADLISSAINGMLSDLDPHSSYLPSDAFSTMQERTKGEFGGLGIEITMQDGYVLVVTPIDDTPAARAGIQSGDLIIEINEQDVFGLTITEAVELMRGAVGSDIDITLRRDDDDMIDITLTRAVIKVRSVRHQSFGDVGYIRITNFTAQTTPGLKKSIAALKDQHGSKLKGLVLDLRNNPGGLLREAISVSNAFLEQGEIVSTRGRRTNQNSRHYAVAGDLVDKLPIVVLINSGSASASEIVAGALKDHERAIIMGTRSFGKGSVQSIIPMSGHGAVRITTARYYTPSGTSIQGMGIEPDIRVELAIVEDIDVNTTREEDLNGALENTSSENTSDTAPIIDNATAAITRGDEAIKDYQLSRAIDLITGISVYRSISE